MKDIKDFIFEVDQASAELSELRKYVKKEFNKAVKNKQIKSEEDLDKFYDEFYKEFEKVENNYKLALHALDRKNTDIYDWMWNWANNLDLL